MEGSAGTRLSADGGDHHRPSALAVRILREVAIPERRFENWSFGALPLMSGHGAESPEAFHVEPLPSPLTVRNRGIDFATGFGSIFK